MLSTLLVLSLGAAPAPELALLCTEPQGPVTELRFQPVGEVGVAPAVARIEHLPGESVQGAVVPGRRAVVAVAPTVPSKDLSFASTLFLLEAQQPARALADRVQHVARPLVTAKGRVFVARGRAGAPDFDARRTLRVDALTLDEVDLRTGAARTVYAFEGYALFPVGEWRGALVVHRVGPAGAALFTVHPDALGVVELGPLPPTARDLVLDPRAGTLLFTAHDGGERWEVLRQELASAARAVLHRGESMAALPVALPDGRVAVSDGPGRGLRGLDRARVLASTGEGFDRVRAFARGGAVAVGLNELPDGRATPFAVELRGGRALVVAAPADRRLDLAGVVEP